MSLTVTLETLARTHGRTDEILELYGDKAWVTRYLEHPVDYYGTTIMIIMDTGRIRTRAEELHGAWTPAQYRRERSCKPAAETVTGSLRFILWELCGDYGRQGMPTKYAHGLTNVSAEQVKEVTI